MKNQFFDSQIFSNLEAPMQKMMELNVKMMQNLSNLKPLDIVNLKKPEDLLQKQMELFVLNGQMALNYMKESFEILESQCKNVCQKADHCAKKSANETSAAFKKKSVPAKKRSFTVKKSAVTAKSVTSTSGTKSIPKKKLKSAVSSSTKKPALMTDRKLPLVERT